MNSNENSDAKRLSATLDLIKNVQLSLLWQLLHLYSLKEWFKIHIFTKRRAYLIVCEHYQIHYQILLTNI